jgi:hypothetical protein
MIRAMAFAAILVAAPAAIGQVYKWVDDKGRTQYSETPPPGVKATRIDTGPAGPAAGPAKAPDWKQQELESRKRRIEQDQKDDVAKRQSIEAGNREEICRLARRDLNLLQQQRPIYHTDKDGKQVYLEDSARPAAIERARRDVETHCGR